MERTSRCSASELRDAESRAEPSRAAGNDERALELARRQGLHDLVADCLLGLAARAAGRRDYAQANRYIEVGIDHCTRHGNDLMLRYFLAEQARAELDQGRWDRAADSAAQVLLLQAVSTLPRIVSLVVLALVRARRGDPDAEPLLRGGLELAEPSGELLRIAPVATARAEVAWLTGRLDEIAPVTAAALALATEKQSDGVAGELVRWRRRAGLDDPQVDVPPPRGDELAGKWAAAAAAWRRLGCPYDAALALAEVDDHESLKQAHEALLELGALRRGRRRRTPLA